MKKKLATITLVLAVAAIYLGIRFAAVERQSKEVKEIKLNSVSAQEQGDKVVKGIIYLPNKNFDKLVKKNVDFEYTTDREKIIQIVFGKVFLEMKSEGLIKDEPQLLNSYFNGKDLYLDVKSNQIFLGNDTKTLYVLYALTNSITELGGVERIKFLIDNRDGKGVLDAYYERNLKF